MIISKDTYKFLNAEANKIKFKNEKPFPNIVIDNFFEKKIDFLISEVFPSYDSYNLDTYSNPIEEKKLINQWNKFKPTCYKALTYLCSEEFVRLINQLVPEAQNFQADIGLHGGGLHMHKKGGKLNVHMDYSLHRN